MSAAQILYVVFGSIAVLAIIFLCVFFPVRRVVLRNHYHYFDYRIIHKIAVVYDYYLINNFSFIASTGEKKNIDHILFANKYIYLINDECYKGDIEGTPKDLSLVEYTKDGRHYIDNPYMSINSTMKEASKMTGLDESLLIGVVIVNDECKVGVTSDSKTIYLIQRRKFKKLIKAIESRDVGLLNPDELASAVKTLDNINLRKGDKK
ncbi:MAG: NERD domain-containing protein [Coprobacillus sp.]|nr:NERD domain-containing protein [Coprobacillus sp.]